MPSSNTERACAGMLPATGPPMSIRLPIWEEKPTSSPSKKIGRITSMSGVCWTAPPQR